MDEKVQDTRSRILNSSIDLFSQKGYTETSVKEIAKASGIQVGTIYNYYDSKARILDRILQMYIDHSRENRLSKEAVDRMVETEEPRSLLKGMFYRYPAEDMEKYTKILRIILHEQYRNEAVGEFMREHFIRGMEGDINYVLEKMIERGRLRPVNHRYYAKMLNDLCLAATTQFSHYQGRIEQHREERILMDEIIAFVIDLILKDGDWTSDDAAVGENEEAARRWMRNSQ